MSKISASLPPSPPPPPLPPPLPAALCASLFCFSGSRSAHGAELADDLPGAHGAPEHHPPVRANRAEGAAAGLDAPHGAGSHQRRLFVSGKRAGEKTALLVVHKRVVRNQVAPATLVCSCSLCKTNKENTHVAGAT